jgi:P pilus assembly chaperone PapD
MDLIQNLIKLFLRKNKIRNNPTSEKKELTRKFMDSSQVLSNHFQQKKVRSQTFQMDLIQNLIKLFLRKNKIRNNPTSEKKELMRKFMDS